MMKKTLLASILSAGLFVTPFASVVYSPAVLAEQPESFSVSHSESRLLNFKQPIKRAMIANPDVASLKVVSANELMLTGRSLGMTKLFINFRNQPQKAHEFVVDVKENPQQQTNIDKTIKELLAKLNPQGTVHYEIRSIWVDASNNLRREVDEIGNQIDGNSDLRNTGRQDQEVLQSEQSVGSSSISSTAGNFMVLLTGDVVNQAQKKRIHSVISALGVSVVNMIKISGPQEVKLEVRVAEVVKGNPFQSGAVFNYQAARGNDLLQTISSVLATTATGSTPLAPILNEAFQVSVQSGNSNFSGILTALEENSLARVLARPQLIVQSGETAEFLVGGEVPIPVSQNADAITVRYKEFGVRLRFSPVITESGEIRMTVAPEISNIDYSAGSESNGLVQPGFRSRRAKTTVTLEPGQSFIVGGLIQDSFQSSISKIPFLGDIPILGALFRSTNYEKDQTELAIVVTPTFVEPIEKGTEISLPGENMKVPSYGEAFWMGKIVEMLPEGESAIPALLSKIGLEKP
ncbi:type II and III secretion system protein family protein [Thiomicrorhabdus xiamenensis]|nr:pilus assembly protein N-terminal domain-containing protein [Thiomicrorhabdus xiamenensis]